MSVIDVALIEESQQRYLTYALSVVSSRALPDVRDGLKPVQRRILYAMANQLRLLPEKAHRKSAAVVGEVLARFHPHGDSACYDALVRMAQDFSLRYPLIDGQGNFGSLDGDTAAAYRYTEARLTTLAIEVIGDIGEETVQERDNFDQTIKEPVVLPSRVPNLLINGAAGIAVGMATSIPPHNLKEVVKALQLLLDDEATTDSKLLSAIKGPDFPTACEILNSKAELKEIYSRGRGPIRMRAVYGTESIGRGREQIVVSAIPYGIEKSSLIEKIADLVLSKKLSQIIDIRDESTEQVRIVMELASGADVEKTMAYLFKYTPLQHNFNVNLTALVPTSNPLSARPSPLSLREMLVHFVDFRIDVTRRKLLFEKGRLEERIHLLEGLVKIVDAIEEVIKIVRKSEGRSDAAAKLQKRFDLTQTQALFIVDLRIYQLSKTSIDEVRSELDAKLARVRAIDKLLKSKKGLRKEVSTDLQRISDEFGDARRSMVVHDYEEVSLDQEDFVSHEDVYVIVTKDGWIKRIKQTNDPETTRIREGDSIFFSAAASTRSSLALFTNMGNVFVQRVYDITATSGYGDPVQKMFRFKDGEQIIACMYLPKEGQQELISTQEILLYTERGYGFRLNKEVLSDTKKTGKRLARLAEGDFLQGVSPIENKLLFLLTEQGYGVCFLKDEVPVLGGAGKGVILQRVPAEDRLVIARTVNKKDKLKIAVTKGKPKDIAISALTIGTRAKRGLKLVKRGAPVLGIE